MPLNGVRGDLCPGRECTLNGQGDILLDTSVSQCIKPAVQEVREDFE